MGEILAMIEECMNSLRHESVEFQEEKSWTDSNIHPKREMNAIA